MGSYSANDVPGGPGARAGEAFRGDDLRRRNRRVGLIVLLIVLLLMIGTVLYVTFIGGANMLPTSPDASFPAGAEGGRG